MLRDAAPDDVGEILSMTRQLAAFEHLDAGFATTEAALAEALFSARPLLRATLAVDDETGAICGHALWHDTFGTFSGRRGIWLEDLFVRDACRRAGHARALLAHLGSLVEGRVAWDVLTWNEGAIALYDRIGARPVREWIRYSWEPSD